MKEILNEITINSALLYGKNFAIAFIIFFVGKFIAKRIVNLLKKSLNNRGIEKTLSNFISNIFYGLAIAFLAIAALGQLGVNTTSLAAMIAAVGLAIGLALQGSLSNIASGVMIIIFKPLKIDDFIEAAGEKGTVEQVGIFTTTLRTPDNKVIIVPNSALTSTNITNYSIKPTRRIDMIFGCGYEDDIKKVKEVISKVLESEKRVLKDPAITIGLIELGDSSVNFAVRPWVKQKDYFPVLFDLNEKIKIEFDKENISIPYPQRDVHLFNSNS